MFKAQSGRLSFGSQLTSQQRQSAIRHRLDWLSVLRRPASGFAPWQATAQASRSRGYRRHCLAFGPRAATVETSLSSAQQTFRQANGLEHPVQQAAEFFGFSWRPNRPLPNRSFNGTSTRFAGCLPLTLALGFSKTRDCYPLAMKSLLVKRCKNCGDIGLRLLSSLNGGNCILCTLKIRHCSSQTKIPTNQSEWSEQSKRSRGFNAEASLSYANEYYWCRNCGAPAVFTAEQQRDMYEVKKKPIYQRRVICDKCWISNHKNT
jgi:hypothetical protein